MENCLQVNILSRTLHKHQTKMSKTAEHRTDIGGREQQTAIAMQQLSKHVPSYEYTRKKDGRGGGGGGQNPG
jgi:hypothetical protein